MADPTDLSEKPHVYVPPGEIPPIKLMVEDIVEGEGPEATSGDTVDAPTDIQARMFTGRMTEDPATGSATAAVTALRAALRGRGILELRVGQGVDMGRACLLLAHAEPRADGVWAGVAGHAVVVMEGTLPAPELG